MTDNSDPNQDSAVHPKRRINYGCLIVFFALFAAIFGGNVYNSLMAPYDIARLKLISLLEYDLPVYTHGEIVSTPVQMNERGINLKSHETLIWGIKQSQFSEPVIYRWDLFLVTPENVEMLKSNGIVLDERWTSYVYVASKRGLWVDGTVEPNVAHLEDDDVSASVVLPSNQAALDIHEELGLPLPSGYSLDTMKTILESLPSN